MVPIRKAIMPILKSCWLDNIGLMMILRKSILPVTQAAIKMLENPNKITPAVISGTNRKLSAGCQKYTLKNWDKITNLRANIKTEKPLIFLKPPRRLTVEREITTNKKIKLENKKSLPASICRTNRTTAINKIIE
jgi:hypothetical protein